MRRYISNLLSWPVLRAVLRFVWKPSGTKAVDIVVSLAPHMQGAELVMAAEYLKEVKVARRLRVVGADGERFLVQARKAGHAVHVDPKIYDADGNDKPA